MADQWEGKDTKKQESWKIREVFTKTKRVEYFVEILDDSRDKYVENRE